jgi:hypothetical protein
MNNLRELISLAAQNWNQHEYWLISHANDIADLIDEAQKIGLTLREDHPLAIALAKLEK